MPTNLPTYIYSGLHPQIQIPNTLPEWGPIMLELKTFIMCDLEIPQLRLQTDIALQQLLYEEEPSTLKGDQPRIEDE